ncbi:hypothetical protein [Pontibacter ramchanderi]|uniref:Uncharacterized protein n=1 Tax=Pontibacter ramchanderi TaxID=1179743 RepID=A0A2N3UD22_9BACT|nr:hypothetical protein [Pontibacter ramchanderi]PKV67289.1 hypothetical protein BD749_2431 [Pontibacter ramchanderi]
MSSYRIIGLLALLCGFTACERPTPPLAAGKEPAYDLTAYLQEQTARLQQEQPPVLKSVITKGQPTETIQLEELDWEKELAIFQEVDLSRPALRDFYSDERHTLPNGSTMSVFTKNVEAAAPVERLQLTVSPAKKLEQLEAVVLEENLLFYSKRNIRLMAEPGTGNLSSYRVEGVQKLIFGDSLRYRVDANL